GWSEYPNGTGTYKNAHTWGELGLVDANGVEKHIVSATENPVTRLEIFRNLHATSGWQTHQAVFTEERCHLSSSGVDQFPGRDREVPYGDGGERGEMIINLMKHMKVGDKLVLYLRSAFPISRISARKAEIKVFYEVEEED
ncbi:hypothetical protein HK102_005752, partial [Quaeritorhiza haematococci]